MSSNYYFILGLDKFSSAEEVRKAYLKMAKKYHPDVNSGNTNQEEKFKRILEAYQILSNPYRKSQYDQSLRTPPKPIIHSRPKYSPRPFFRQKKREYTPKAWLYGRIFIIVFIMAIVLIPIYLLYQSSVRYYERGIEYYNQGEVYSALSSFNRAISNFGGKSVEASIRAAEIYIYELKDYEGALSTITRGIDHVEKPENRAILLYMRGVSYYGNQKPEKALYNIKMADSLGYNKDSIIINLAFINAFALDDFYSGSKYFNQMIRRKIKPETAWFGKAWCQQQLSQWNEAKNSYSEVIALNDRNSLAYSFRGRMQMQLADTTAACKDFSKALKLGDSKAADLLELYCKPSNINHED